ncbi:hypothetical protein CASFOL_037017 [Castilleja foliolosa]|uniref:Transposase n=1 Tax=Castilleja foliolosa TaxID=1961234 RepID=A0ABD3BQA2_9LAMI
MRLELAPQERGKGYYLPPACFTLTKLEKKIFCECLYGIKVPSGYCSNIKNYVSLKDHKLVGMKSHDCHILMQHLLPVAIRGILPNHVRHAITRLCFFFNAISSKVIDPEKLDELQREVVVTLCQMEMYFPPSFFDIMVHLVVHLVREIKICGPVFLHYMWPYERHMGYLKSKVKNRGRPEGSIIRGVIDEEVLEFCTPYLPNTDHLGLPKSRHEGRLQGVGTIGRNFLKNIEDELVAKAHLLVLQHLQIVHPYLIEHQKILKSRNPLRTPEWLTQEHNRTFASWLKDLFFSKSSILSNDVGSELKWLAYGPKTPINSYEGYDINGYTFYTSRQDAKSVLQNSGVTLVASSFDYSSASNNNPSQSQMSYYGRIEEIWELDYVEFKFGLFRCKWVDNRRGVRHDDMGFTLVDFSRCGYQNDPFILASQAEQVFYVEDCSDRKWSVVVPTGKKLVGHDEQVELDELVDEMPSFSIGIPPVDVQSDHGEDDLPFVSTHSEGLLIT